MKQKSGLYGSDQLAAKVASRELLSTNMLAASVRNLQLEREVFFPLMTYVSFGGRAVLCSSILPLSKGSLIYGSCDGTFCSGFVFCSKLCP
jgi:hypothetical protein